MRIETKNVNELKPADYNPRVELKPGMDEYERLKRSLAEFELVQPLVWNERTGHVVGGHQRLGVLKAEGTEEEQVVVVDLPLEREKALNIALNNERVGGRWDVEKLQDLVTELIELPEIDETLTGFSPEELNELMLKPAWSGEEIAEEDEQIVVTCKVAEDEWDGFRAELDELLKEFDVELHVRMPGGG